MNDGRTTCRSSTEVAQRIACRRDEPRYIGDQDVFALQEKVVAHILSNDLELEARAAAPTTVDPIQNVTGKHPTL